MKQTPEIKTEAEKEILVADDQIDDLKLKFYEILRKRINRFVTGFAGEYGNKFTGYLLALPDFFILLLRLAADKRVTSSQKMFVGGIIAYVMLPIDIIPDFIPFIGYIDDLVLVVYGLNLILNEVDKQIIIDNWSGEENVLELLSKVTSTAEKFLDRNFLKKIQRWISNLRK
ncbi:MAG: hypothetical protein APR54_05845 [Candidatus Cloacimonas sp. SDB]|nr:MAG: hypothetical protein APR54_05845 [Candidatus Cloacimonas sp. SDB]